MQIMLYFQKTTGLMRIYHQVPPSDETWCLPNLSIKDIIKHSVLQKALLFQRICQSVEGGFVYG